MPLLAEPTVQLTSDEMPVPSTAPDLTDTPQSAIIPATEPTTNPAISEPAIRLVSEPPKEEPTSESIGLN